MKNPISKSNLFATPTAEDLTLAIESLPKKDRALVWKYVMFTMNMCHAQVEAELNKETV